MADGKWIDGLNAGIPVAAAARLVLAQRFAVVCTHLPLAVERPYEDSEYVHQLRVGTRRARAALEVFRECLPKKDVKEAKAALRKIRRAAGDARDWDVFIHSLQTARPLQIASGKPTLDFLLGYAFGQRSAAQIRLTEAAQRTGPKLIERSTALTERIREPRTDAIPESFGDLAVFDLGERLEQFTLSVQTDPSEAADLHKLRILGKHLRYAIEIFAPCFEPSLKEKLYPAVEALQELLGGLQDAAVGIERLEGLRSMAQQSMPTEWTRLKPGIAKIMQGLRAKLRAGRKRFQTWRTGWEMVVGEHPLKVMEAQPIAE